VRPLLRGFGPSRVTVGEAQSDQFAALAQDVIDLADALRIYRFGVVGQDWGSPAGHAAAVLAPERVTWLVALACLFAERTRE
jgi:pimeloyl-ACP methyl ester carboxylesterase